MFITEKHLSRRTVLKGMGRDDGAAVPRGDGAGVAASARRERRRQEDAARLPSRWCTASAGSTQFGIKKNLWAPAERRPRLRS